MVVVRPSAGDNFALSNPLFQFPCGNYGRCKVKTAAKRVYSFKGFNSHAGIMVVVSLEVFTNSEHGCKCFNSHAGIMVVVRGIAGNEYIL